MQFDSVIDAKLHHMKQPGKLTRRTTVTLPAAYLDQIEALACEKNTTVSATLSEFVSEGLRQHASQKNGHDVVAAYQRIFGSFSEEEMLLLDGVVMEPIQRRKR